MKPLSLLVNPRKSVFDNTRRDVVLDITDLLEDKISPEEFFEENFITQGMAQLYKAVMQRLEGKSDDGVFRLTQSMGGGKTHNLITVGLLAKHPAFRDKIMGSIHKTTLSEEIKVVGFSGRENPQYGIWGYVAEKMGKKELFNPFYEPLQAPGQSAWINLLRDEKVLILLDELPPYFNQAITRPLAAGTLADASTAALSNLFVAMGKSELKNVALIITDLSANYSDGSALINQALDNLKDETNRSARNFSPVAQSGDELYHILRTRLFENVAPEKEIEVIADAYGDKIREANKIGIVSDTPVSFANSIRDSYPFHPSIKDLFARFKENPGFMQTRGLIRLMRTMTSRMFDAKFGWANAVYLITPYDLDFSDADTANEINSINPRLINAISHDIFSNGKAEAELIDERLQNKLGTTTANFLLVSYLSSIPNANRGLKDYELIRDIIAPGIDISKIASEVLPELKNRCWYLHLDNTGKFLFKDVQNVIAKLKDYVRGYNEQSILLEIKKKLLEIFKPTLNDCYQKIFSLPAIDEIDLEQNKISLIIYKPHTGGLHPDLQRLFDDEQYRNRFLFISGDTMGMPSVIENAAGLKAIDTIIGEFSSEKVPTNDPQFIQATEILDNIKLRFLKSLEETFVKLFYPTKRGLLDATLNFNFTANSFNAEEAIKKTLKDKRKFLEEIDLTAGETFQRYVEGKLFDGQQSVLWNDLKKRAATNTDWIWYKPNALDQLRDTLTRQDLWRENGEWIQKGPFPPPIPSISVRQIERNDDTGEVKLKIAPLHGDAVLWEVGESVSRASSKLDFNDPFITSDMEVAFLCCDTKRPEISGETVKWQNSITLKNRFFQSKENKQMLELSAAPSTANIMYTTNGSQDVFSGGGKYEGPFEVPSGTTFIIAAAEKHGIRSELRSYKVPDRPGGGVNIDKNKAARLNRKVTKQSTAEVFEWMRLVVKHRIQVIGASLEIRSTGENWANLDIGSALMYDGEHLTQMLDFLKKTMLPDGELSLTVAKLQFHNGQQLLDYNHDTKGVLNENEIEQ